jgi:Uma2 family endonuclease
MPNLPQKFKAAPDLAVEIVSPDEDIFGKAEDYLHAGTQQVWAVYPDKHMVYVFTLDADGTIRSKPFGIDDTLDGGSFLPGFTLPVREIFPATQIAATSAASEN